MISADMHLNDGANIHEITVNASEENQPGHQSENVQTMMRTSQMDQHMQAADE